MSREWCFRGRSGSPIAVSSKCNCFYLARHCSARGRYERRPMTIYNMIWGSRVYGTSVIDRGCADARDAVQPMHAPYNFIFRPDWAPLWPRRPILDRLLFFISPIYDWFRRRRRPKYYDAAAIKRKTSWASDASSYKQAKHVRYAATRRSDSYPTGIHDDYERCGVSKTQFLLKKKERKP